MCFSTFLSLCWHVLWPVNWSLVQAWAFYQLWKQDGRDLKVSYFLCTAGGTGCCYTRPSHFTSSLLKAEGLFGKKKMRFNHNQLDFSYKTAFAHMQILNDRQTYWCFSLITLCIVSSAAITGHDACELYRHLSHGALLPLLCRENEVEVGHSGSAAQRRHSRSRDLTSGSSLMDFRRQRQTCSWLSD